MISSQLTSHFLTGPCRFTPSATALKTSPLGLSPSNLEFPFNRVYGLNLFFISSHDVGGLRRSACISSPLVCWDRMTHLNPQTHMQSYDIFPYWCLGVSVSPHRLCLGSSGPPRPDKHAFMTAFNARHVFTCVPYAQIAHPAAASSPDYTYLHLDMCTLGRAALLPLNSPLKSCQAAMLKGQYNAFHYIRLCCCTAQHVQLIARWRGLKPKCNLSDAWRKLKKAEGCREQKSGS